MQFPCHFEVRYIHYYAHTLIPLHQEKQDNMNGKDFISRSLGPNATRRHKHFRRFLACQNLVVSLPPLEKAPNFKFGEFCAHILKVIMSAWIFRIKLLVEEQTIGFQGR